MLAIGLLSALLLSRPGRFLLDVSRGHLSLMLGAVPLADAIEHPDLSEAERTLLSWVPRIKSYGEEAVGLRASRNYETLNPDFEAQVWNVSASAADRFEPYLYRFPIVGALPYTGFFGLEAAEEEQRRLQELGLDTWVRSAGAYSTLGWFHDPLWRSMLRWDLDRLANTVLHELVHATLWLPGYGSFNESFASFVADKATESFVADVATELPQLAQHRRLRQEDEERYRSSFRGLYQELEELYQQALPRSDLLEQKAELIAAARQRHQELPWNFPAYGQAMAAGRVVNNARLLQFSVYNRRSEVFDEALQRFSGDLRALVVAARTLPQRSKQEGDSFDPWQAMAQLVPGSGPP